jgi:hypothetical protein
MARSMYSLITASPFWLPSDPGLLECLTAACKALSLANSKGKGTNGLVIGALD